jgi:hypothetical protein
MSPNYKAMANSAKVLIAFALTATNAFAAPFLLAELTFGRQGDPELGQPPASLTFSVSSSIGSSSQQLVNWQQELTPSDVGSVVSLPMALGENLEHPDAWLESVIYNKDASYSLETILTNGWHVGPVTRLVPKIGIGLSGYDVWQTTVEIEQVFIGIPREGRWGWNGRYTLRIYGVQSPDYLDGDYNGDGSVDAADYVMARNGTGDLATWRSMFGTTSGGGSAIAAMAPEPEPNKVVVNDNVFFSAGDEGGSTVLSFDVTKNAGGTGGLPVIGISFRYDGQQLIRDIGATSDINGVDFYFVEPGEPFSELTIASGQSRPMVLWNKAKQYPVPFGPGDVWLGINTGHYYSGGFGSEKGSDRDAFGWVHLRQVDGKYQMVGNAMAYESRGIIVGTTQTVPEPAGLLLSAIAFSGPAIWTRNRQWRSIHRIRSTFGAIQSVSRCPAGRDHVRTL